MRIATPILAATLALGLSGGALAQGAATPPGTTPGRMDRTAPAPGSARDAAETGVGRTTGAAPAGNPTQDTTGAIGHPKSNNSNGATTAPAAR